MDQSLVVLFGLLIIGIFIVWIMSTTTPVTPSTVYYQSPPVVDRVVDRVPVYTDVNYGWNGIGYGWNNGFGGSFGNGGFRNGFGGFGGSRGGHWGRGHR